MEIRATIEWPQLSSVRDQHIPASQQCTASGCLCCLQLLFLTQNQPRECFTTLVSNPATEQPHKSIT